MKKVVVSPVPPLPVPPVPDVHPDVKVVVVAPIPRLRIAVGIMIAAVVLLFVAITWEHSDPPQRLSRYLGGDIITD